MKLLKNGYISSSESVYCQILILKRLHIQLIYFIPGYQLTLAQQPSSNQSGQPCGQQVMRPRARQQPQLKIAKTCLVATFVRFLLWLPYVIHLVRLSVRQASGYAPLGDVSILIVVHKLKRDVMTAIDFRVFRHFDFEIRKSPF